VSRLSLKDALQLVHRYGDCGSPKFEAALMKWLRRYLGGGSPELSDIAKVVAGLVERRERSMGRRWFRAVDEGRKRVQEALCVFVLENTNSAVSRAFL